MFENIMGDVSLDRFQLLEDIIAVDRVGAVRCSLGTWADKE